MRNETLSDRHSCVSDDKFLGPALARSIQFNVDVGTRAKVIGRMHQSTLLVIERRKYTAQVLYKSSFMSSGQAK